MSRYWAIIFLLSAVVLPTGATQARTLKVILVMSDSTPVYQQFSISFDKALAASMADVSVIESQLLNKANADLIVAVGMKASELAAAQTDIPVLATMVPRAGYEELLSHARSNISTRPISAIYLDQPWGRQIDFLRAAIPGRRRIGLLHSLNAPIDFARLHQDVAQRGGLLVAQPTLSASELFSSLESVLALSDVLLAVPDSMIYNSSSIRNILLTSYHHGIPLIGLSQAYVNAGALCAIFSTPEQLAAQTSATVISFAQSGLLHEPQYPVDFTIAVNQQVARSLEIEFPSSALIRGQMDQAKEKGP